MEDIRPRLPNGIAEMHIPKMEPLRIQSAVLESGNDLRVDFNNIDLYGLTNFKLLDGNFDLKSDAVRVDLLFGKVYGEADYTIKGKLLFFNLNGAGRVNGTLREFSQSLKKTFRCE